MATVEGLLDLCIEDLDAGNAAEARENVVAAAETVKRATRKVESILDIARGGRQKLAPETFDIGPDMRAIWADLTAGATDPPRLEIDLDGAATVTTERKTLNVILENLSSNAIRYVDRAKPDPWVRVRARLAGEQLRLQFADNGLGIAREVQPLVFQMFKRLDDRSRDGLGLSLVHKHVDRMGGSISLASTPGEGTEFTILLPIPNGDPECANP
jgi:signal transduction histidine kinase